MAGWGVREVWAIGLSLLKFICNYLYFPAFLLHKVCNFARSEVYNYARSEVYNYARSEVYNYARSRNLANYLACLVCLGIFTLISEPFLCV